MPEGLDLAVQKMKKGETAEITLTPQYSGRDAAVTYTVQLQDFENVRIAD